MDIEFDEILGYLRGDDFWLTHLSSAAESGGGMGIHVAIFAEPFLSLVLSRRKTIESRFSRYRCAPYGEVFEGDIILIKEVAGPICGVALAGRVWSFDLEREPITRIKERFARDICGDDAFWASLEDARYATIIELASTVPVAPTRCDKRDRRGWVSLRSRQLAFNFP